MQRGFAMSAATSNLFQPYNVGKFNLSAAVGGYNSENAVAVGSGYRFNENVAVKASRQPQHQTAVMSCMVPV